LTGSDGHNIFADSQEFPMLRRGHCRFTLVLFFLSVALVAHAQPAPPKFVQKLPQPNWQPAMPGKPGSPPKAETRTTGAPASLEQVLKEPYFVNAVTVARSRIHESVPGWINVAGIMVLAWSLARLKWLDIYAPENETSWGKVAQNPKGEFGKRLCVEGIIRSMVLRKEHGSAYYHGLLYPNLSLDGYYFLALGNSGNYVPGSTARFCGVAVGITEGTNGYSMPMTAVAMTGFFDLAINQL
jgi:hypothetical protein